MVLKVVLSTDDYDADVSNDEEDFETFVKKKQCRGNKRVLKGTQEENNDVFRLQGTLSQVSQSSDDPNSICCCSLLNENSIRILKLLIDTIKGKSRRGLTLKCELLGCLCPIHSVEEVRNMNLPNHRTSGYQQTPKVGLAELQQVILNFLHCFSSFIY